MPASVILRATRCAWRSGGSGSRGGRQLRAEADRRRPLSDPRSSGCPSPGQRGSARCVDRPGAVRRGRAPGDPRGDGSFCSTWLHEADRSVLRVHPRDDESRPLTGVFATRSSDRPNPLGLHEVTVLGIDGLELAVGPLEAIDGTPSSTSSPCFARRRAASPRRRPARTRGSPCGGRRRAHPGRRTRDPFRSPPTR